MDFSNYRNLIVYYKYKKVKEIAYKKKLSILNFLLISTDKKVAKHNNTDSFLPLTLLAPSFSNLFQLISDQQKNRPKGGFLLSVGYEKDEFTFLIDGFEPLESFSPIKGISVPPSDGNHKAGWKC